MRAEERARQVDLDDRSPLVDRELFERYRRGSDARVVEEQVEPAEARLDRREEGLDRGRIGDVADVCQRLALDGCSRLLERLEPAAGNDDGPAGPPELACDRAADAAAAARDQRDAGDGATPASSSSR